jgi:penicillin-insensitive murein endopeptidase
MKIINIVIFISIFFLISCSHHLPNYAASLNTRLPIESKPEAVGDYSLGCLLGAQTFSGEESGLLISQMKRGRYWGHPNLIKILTSAGIEFKKINKTIIVGDLSQSRGGPTLSGHNSHQTGLDVDIWFKMFKSSNLPSLRVIETEEMEPISELGIDQLKLINFFAADENVDRIFINPTFKKNLCLLTGTQKLSAENQHKLRAWWGHDDHIHVRLKCPSDSPRCLSQKPIPSGDGCGDDLNWWFSDEAKSGLKDYSLPEANLMYLEKIKKLPKECSFYSE